MNYNDENTKYETQPMQEQRNSKNYALLLDCFLLILGAMDQ